MSINQTLYRRNNKGQPCFWYPEIKTSQYEDVIIITHGICGKTTHIDRIKTNRDLKAELDSRIKEKRKAGYKYINELRDNNELPVEGKLIEYLNSYLPTYRDTSDGIMLPMLAKVYDNSNNKLFKKINSYLGQWKINGLRCFISAYKTEADLFNPIRLRFQSREGTIWNSLNDLEEYLLSTLPSELLEAMVEEEYILDGEVYLPGHSVNEINHFVKDANCPENKLIQYWCYDIAIRDTIQRTRMQLQQKFLYTHIKVFTKEEHLNNTNRLVCLPCYHIDKDDEAIRFRNKFIDLGFEGLILRNPEAEYQYGARNSAMIKFKKSTDGKFKIIDIYPEGQARANIPLFKLKNDINDETFEVHVGGSFRYQESILINKKDYIGKYMYVEYGERSGINQVPFHVKNTYIL